MSNVALSAAYAATMSHSLAAALEIVSDESIAPTLPAPPPPSAIREARTRRAARIKAGDAKRRERRQLRILLRLDGTASKLQKWAVMAVRRAYLYAANDEYPTIDELAKAWLTSVLVAAPDATTWLGDACYLDGALSSEFPGEGSFKATAKSANKLAARMWHASRASKEVAA